MRPTPRRFTESEDNIIRARYRSGPARDIARELGRSVHQIRKRARKLGLSTPLKRWSAEEDSAVRSGWREGRLLGEVADELGRRIGEVSSRARMLGCTPWRKGSGTHSGRPIDGFNSGTPAFTHRAVMERMLGRPLRSSEIVHHIDFDKFNNKPSNLHLFKSRSEHRKAHCSFESVVPALVERGIIKFDSTEGVYRLCETNK